MPQVGDGCLSLQLTTSRKSAQKVKHDETTTTAKLAKPTTAFSQNEVQYNKSQLRQIAAILSMCQTSYLRSTTCHHHWLSLVQPCAPGFNLSNCSVYGNRAVVRVSQLPPHPVHEIAAPHSCPMCDFGGSYNRDRMRIVRSTRNGFRVGRGPGWDDLGFDVRRGGAVGCRVM
ncbi:hypothetical protein IWX49DRAFT_310641 [Phyllosticta citricarpa]|uniref:Uncharacterized protein n=2 Tax=Phyllosticta TaxID=121621 RepID=A0ABR1LEL0_9PEZI